MFSLNDNVMDKNGKIFSIIAVEQKDFGTGNMDYFVMKPLFRYDFNPGYLAYIPVERSESLLRSIITKDEALELIDSISDLDPFPEIAPRERRNFFAKAIASGDRKEVLRVIKSLVQYRETRNKANKPFSDYDRRLLDSLKVMFDNEISLALGITPEMVASFVQNRTGFVL
jgi:CarD family transcriptional regulator